ncbi:sulfite exporter TauE/SafE family protein [Brevibacillus sp. SYSU BS000544]|uniref:sulfite exporter TauE/SafE family protein n=1 Tax=Brevibacillus sp. SYSU BS000544 TaxID=3416443 RepID=UPI003CE4E54C
MNKNKSFWAVTTAIPIGCLGGLIGLGGAEFRLPVLVGLFKYSARQAVSLNLAVSLITVISSLIFRLPQAPLQDLLAESPVILALISGGILGANAGAQYAKHLTERALEKVILVLLVAIGCLLLIESVFALNPHGLSMSILTSIVVGIIMGTIIGAVSSLLGVAGGELIIPTLILIFGVDIKVAGTASLLISLPTVMIGLLRHRKNGAFQKKEDLTQLVLPMGFGSIIGALIGGMLMGAVSNSLLKLILGLILIISACKMYLKVRKKEQHKK